MLNSEFKDRAVITVTLGAETLTLETAVSTEAVTQGLSGRTKIPADGMLFVFPQAEPRYFWMKDMNFPLDMIWLRDKTIVGITYGAAVPPENERHNPAQFYNSPVPADMVIEVEAGRAVSFAVGMKLEVISSNTIRRT
jgi:uncharacterized membrane protein (UPF0127 family)